MPCQNKVEQRIENSQERILLLDVNLPFMEWVIQSKNPKAKELLFAISHPKGADIPFKQLIKPLEILKIVLIFQKNGAVKQKNNCNIKLGFQPFNFANGFLCACQTVEDAIKIAKLAIQKQ